MQTVPKNRTSQVISQIAAVKSYTLENCFSGKTLTDIPAFLAYVDRLGSGKVRFDKETGKGKITFHSNAWYEFEVRQ
jgi:hypothetical protein